MKLYEYEGKELFREVGIPVPTSELALTGEEALSASRRIGFPVMVKAQVLAGGRGKVGLVKKVENEETLLAVVKNIRSRIAKTELLLIEETIPTCHEGYLGITIDDVIGVPVLVVAAQGGIDVEKAMPSHQKVAQEYINVQQGLYYHQTLNALDTVGYQGRVLKELADLAEKLYQVFVTYEADTVEVNPVMILEDGKVIAGDSKVVLDDYALFRNKKIQKYHQTRLAGSENNQKAIYVPLDGNIGIISLGASNTMMLIDSIKYLGGSPANFADVAGGVDYDTVYELSTLILKESQERAKVIVINFKLAGASLKAVTEGVRDAVLTVRPEVPMIANIQVSGAARLEMGVDEAISELKKIGISYCGTLEETIDQAIKLSKELVGGEA